MQTLDQAIKQLGSLNSAFSCAAKNGDFSKLSQLGSSFSDQNKGLSQASLNIEKFAKDKCNIDLNSGSSSSTSNSSDSLNFSDLSNLSDLSSLDSVLSELSSFSFSS
jgi:hypothetical protein